MPENIIDNSDFSQIITMDKADSEGKSELKELLEELAQIDTAEETITANKKKIY